MGFAIHKAWRTVKIPHETYAGTYYPLDQRVYVVMWRRIELFLIYGRVCHRSDPRGPKWPRPKVKH